MGVGNELGGDRGGRIRTDDFLLPKQALYQAELHPEAQCSISGPSPDAAFKAHH